MLSTFNCAIPLCMDKNKPWEMIRLDLPTLVLKAFGTIYRETVKLSIHANCRIRRVYFSKRLYDQHLLPPEYTYMPKTRTRTERLQKAEEKTSPRTPPPSIFTGHTILSEDLEDEDVEAECLSQLFLPRSISSQEVNTLP